MLQRIYERIYEYRLHARVVRRNMPAGLTLVMTESDISTPVGIEKLRSFVLWCADLGIESLIVYIAVTIDDGLKEDVTSQIVDRLEDRAGTYVIQGEYSHEDFRAFLAEYAELFIGARMHANIAAVSVGVPTLALAYSQKTHGIIGKMLGLSDFIVDVRQVRDGDEFLAEMISKVNMLWERRSIVKKDLSKRVTKVREKAQMYIEVLRGDLL